MTYDRLHWSDRVYDKSAKYAYLSTCGRYRVYVNERGTSAYFDGHPLLEASTHSAQAIMAMLELHLRGRMDAVRDTRTPLVSEGRRRELNL